MRFARDEVGITDQQHLAQTFRQACEDIGTLDVGAAWRAMQLSVTLGERLLRLHMTSEQDAQKARVLAETMSKTFLHHGFALTPSEAKKLGLKASEADETLAPLLWSLWLDFENEMEMRKQFSPMGVLAGDPSAAALFDLSASALQTVVASLPIRTTTIHAAFESLRYASRYAAVHRISGLRAQDLQIRMSVAKESEGWTPIDIPPTEAQSNTSNAYPGEAKPSKQSKKAPKVQ